MVYHNLGNVSPVLPRFTPCPVLGYTLVLSSGTPLTTGLTRGYSLQLQVQNWPLYKPSFIYISIWYVRKRKQLVPHQNQMINALHPLKLLFDPGQTSPEVQNRGINCPRKRTYDLKINQKKQDSPPSGNHKRYRPWHNLSKHIISWGTPFLAGGVPHPDLAQGEGVPHPDLTGGYTILAWPRRHAPSWPSWRVPHHRVPHHIMRYPPSGTEVPSRKEPGTIHKGTPWEVTLISHWCTLGKDMRPGEVLWNGEGVHFPLC